MPVVEPPSNLFHDYQGTGLMPDPLLKAGRLIVATGNVTLTSTDLENSVYPLLDLPADCILHPQTYFDVTDLPLVAVRIGTFSDVDALVSQAQSDANIISPIAQGDANHDKRLWEVLGLASDPGGFIRLALHAIADTTGNGSMQFQVHYLYH